MDKKFALMASFCFILVMGNLFYLPQIVSEFRSSQDQYLELSEDYQQLQEAYELHLEDSGPRYTGNPFSTQLWPGQLQSENITGMHWYSLYNGALVNVTDNVLGLGAVGEGAYTTWTHVWSRDYTPETAFLLEAFVDNSGTVFAEDSTAEDTYVRTYAGAETNTADHTFFLQNIKPRPAKSMAGRYILGSSLVSWDTFDVWEYGSIIFSRNVTVDEPDAIQFLYCAMSPNGKYIAILADKVSTFVTIVMLYEGS